MLRRHQGQIELTDIGSRLLQRAQAMLGLAETMRQEALDARGMKQGTLRIGSFGPTATMRLLPAILDIYRDAYPGIAVHVDEGPDRQVVQWILERRVDVGFVVLPDERFDTYPLIEDQMVVLLPDAHPLARKDSVSLKELCGLPFVLSGAGSAEIVNRLFLSARLQPDIRYRTSQLLSTLDVVARGDAVTIVAESSLPLSDEPRYVVRPLNPPAGRRVGLAVVDAHQLSPAAKAFIQLASSRPWLESPDRGRNTSSRLHLPGG